MRMLTAALFAISKNQKQPKYPLIEDQINCGSEIQHCKHEQTNLKNNGENDI